jgi:uncharacterized protein DUF222
MRTSDSRSSLGLLQAGIAGLADTDITALPDEQVRELLSALLVANNQLHAVLAALVASFDTRDLAPADGFGTVKGWLVAFGRLSLGAASALLAKGRLLRQLPKLAAAARRGEASSEHLAKVEQLAAQVGVGAVAEADEILATACASLRPSDLARLCERIRAYVDPDGPEPDPGADFERRSVVLSRSGRMLLLRGLLDPEAGAALRSALDALMTAPAVDDFRTAPQRRADALAELARQSLNHGQLPTVGGIRPHLGILITPSTLLHGHSPIPEPEQTPAQPDHDDGDHGDDQHDQDWSDDLDYSEACHDDVEPDECDSQLDEDEPSEAEPHQAERDHEDQDQPEHEHDHAEPTPAEQEHTGCWGGDAGVASSKDTAQVSALLAGIPPPRQPAWLEWFGEVPAALAQRLACDASVWRVVLDPRTGLPLDVGRSMRLVPHWMRKALHARDRGCRWPGCTSPGAWTDCHHLDPWYLGGRTIIDRLIQLCRWHHVRVHEGGWRIELDRYSGELAVYRPDGSPYEIAPSQPWLAPTIRRGDPPTPTTPPARRAA